MIHGGYKEGSTPPAIYQQNIGQIGDNITNTTNGNQSPISGNDTTQTITPQKEDIKKKDSWWKKIVDKIIDSAVPIIVAGIIASLSTWLLTSQAHNQSGNQPEQIKSTPKEHPDTLQKSRT